ncbi:hypothetical protein BX600DRAFT_543454 [Xylariales sp. PMI_506]|nr:hypothetical protein BX600DRAFT_543454 [Xylariales sp. PMI_506]
MIAQYSDSAWAATSLQSHLKGFELRGSATTTRRRVNGVSAVCMLASVLFLYVYLLHVPYISYPSAGREQTTPMTFVSEESLIAPYIWQIIIPQKSISDPIDIDVQELGNTHTWMKMNRGYSYNLVTLDTADEFAETYYENDTTIFNTFKSLRDPMLKSDLLRYLTLGKMGGVFTDIDAAALQPVDTWISPAFRGARLVVGIEVDKLSNESSPAAAAAAAADSWMDTPRDLQFSQRTIAAAPDHRVFRRVLEKARASLDELASARDASIEQLSARPGGKAMLTGFEVLSATGAAAWTDAVWEELRAMDLGLESIEDLSGLQKPTLYGDILVMPIGAFATGAQGRREVSSSSPSSSPSGEENTGEVEDIALVRHMPRGSRRQ